MGWIWLGRLWPDLLDFSGWCFIFPPSPQNLRLFSFPVKFWFYISGYTCLRRHYVPLLPGVTKIYLLAGAQIIEMKYWRKIKFYMLNGWKPIRRDWVGATQKYNLAFLKLFRDCCPIWKCPWTQEDQILSGGCDVRYFSTVFCIYKKHHPLIQDSKVFKSLNSWSWRHRAQSLHVCCLVQANSGTSPDLSTPLPQLPLDLQWPFFRPLLPPWSSVPLIACHLWFRMLVQGLANHCPWAKSSQPLEGL